MNLRVSWSEDPGAAECAALEEALLRGIQQALVHGQRPAHRVDAIIVDDEALAELHARFLDDPTPTDVISFDLLGDGDPLPGDPGPDAELYISLDCARRVSAERGVSLERELVLYGVHGTLHLCGFDDHEPEERAAMRSAELAVLRQLGYPDDSLPHE